MTTQVRNRDGLRQMLTERIGRGSAPSWRYDLCRSVPLFIELMDEAHDRPIDSVAASVRDIIVTQCLTGAGTVSHDPVMLDRHVALVTEAMEKARLDELARGEWDDTPVTPQMFG